MYCLTLTDHISFPVLLLLRFLNLYQQKLLFQFKYLNNWVDGNWFKEEDDMP